MDSFSYSLTFPSRSLELWSTASPVMTSSGWKSPPEKRRLLSLSRSARMNALTSSITACELFCNSLVLSLSENVQNWNKTKGHLTPPIFMWPLILRLQPSVLSAKEAKPLYFLHTALLADTAHPAVMQRDHSSEMCSLFFSLPVSLSSPHGSD